VRKGGWEQGGIGGGTRGGERGWGEDGRKGSEVRGRVLVGEGEGGGGRG